MLRLSRNFNHTKYLAICYGESFVNEMLRMCPMTGLLLYGQTERMNSDFLHAYVLHWVLFRVLKWKTVHAE